MDTDSSNTGEFLYFCHKMLIFKEFFLFLFFVFFVVFILFFCFIANNSTGVTTMDNGRSNIGEFLFSNCLVIKLVSRK